MRYLLAVLALLAPFAACAAPTGFTLCGPDGDTCDLLGRDGYVTFGAGSGSCDVSALTCSSGYTVPQRITPASNFFVVCRLEIFGSVDPAPGQSKACYFQDISAAPPYDGGGTPGGEFSFTNTAHLLQAILVMGHVFMLWIGFRAGDKV